MRRAWDLLCVVYYAPDRIQHYFWPELTGADGDPDVRRALDANYVALDEALGNLVDKGVTIVECDKEAFRKRVAPQTDNFIKARPEAKPVVDAIRATQA